MKSSLKTGLTADQEDCIGYFPNNFEAKTYFDISTLGDVVVNCKNEILQSGKMEKENIQEECSFKSLFENSYVHGDTSGIVAEDEIQHYMMSHKRKRSDVDDNNVPTMPQLGETEPCNFNLPQLFASGKIEIVY